MIGTYCRVWDCAGGNACIMADDEPRIDAAVSRYLESGKTHDTLLDLTMVDGRMFKILASDVRNWLVSTPDGRRQMHEWEAAHAAEEREFKQAAGVWEDAT